MRRKLICYLLGLFLSIAANGTTLFTQADSQKPLQIEATTAEFDRETATSSYTDQVKIDQGSTHVEGHKVTTKQDKTNKLQEIIIYGSPKTPAYYETIPEANKPKLIATAITIKYYPDRQYVILLGTAQLTQGDNAISGEHIEYDLVKQKMRAVPTLKADGAKTRTTIVINPEQTHF